MRPETIITTETDASWAEEQLNLFRQKFDPILSAFLAKETEAATAIRPELAELLKVSSDFIMAGGKRLRPAFTYFGYKAAGGQDDEAILRAAVPMELVHAGALIHDDVMDNSDIRRGNPTVHKVFEKNLGSKATGTATAIVAGDQILALADRALSEYPHFDERFRNARKIFDQMCVEINFGQYLDVIGNLLGVVDDDWVMKVMRFKTAGYTVEKPLLIGSVLAGADSQKQKILSGYGVPLGIAFQIRDDILGMFGKEAEVKKPVDSDLKEGKKTLLVIHAVGEMENQNRWEERQRFLRILGNPELSENDYHWCQDLMTETGALKYCEDQVEIMTEQAKMCLSRGDFGLQEKRYLLGIADYLVARKH
ncbi:MAG: Polyprenyl synthetase [Parcubacteria group bacterium GW2011_GWC2_45_7]|nr:MAG: Polyprenyl synthetase [Parcubacteria group bacterium GW2011_GWC2_45_7]